MRHAVATLEGALLDAAVAAARGCTWTVDPYADGFILANGAGYGEHAARGFVLFSPSRLWEDGGPIIQRERIVLLPRARGGSSAAMIPFRWRISSEPEIVSISATSIEDPMKFDVIPGPVEVTLESDCVALGGTPLIAAMRAYVMAKFGAEVELP